MTIESVDLKEKIERASRVAVVIPPDAPEETYLAAAALAGKMERKAFIIGGSREIKQRWQTFFDIQEEPKKEFIISINTTEYPVDALKYETRGDELKIFLSPRFSLAPEHLRFEETYPRSSLIIAIGFRSREEEEDALRVFPLEEDGEIVSLRSESAEKMALSPLKLFARMILRSRAEPIPQGGAGRGTSVLWSFISREDFTKTDTTSPYIPPLLPLWQKLMPPSRFAVFLWQEKETEQISGLIHSCDKPALERVATALGARLASDYFVIPPMFGNFTEAEFKIRRLLKEAA